MATVRKQRKGETVKYRITTQRQLRREFWETFPDLPKRRTVDYGNGHKQHATDTRVTFCDWLDALSKDGSISQELAQRATL